MMNAARTEATITGGITVSVTRLSGAGTNDTVKIKRTGDQRDGDRVFTCNLLEWPEVRDAVETLRNMMGKVNG